MEEFVPFRLKQLLTLSKFIYLLRLFLWQTVY